MEVTKKILLFESLFIFSQNRERERQRDTLPKHA
jgi:hypothetical protein